MSISNSSSNRDSRAAKYRLAQRRREQKAEQRRRSVLTWGRTSVAVGPIADVDSVRIASEQANRPSLDAVKGQMVRNTQPPVTVAVDKRLTAFIRSYRQGQVGATSTGGTNGSTAS